MLFLSAEAPLLLSERGAAARRCVFANKCRNLGYAGFFLPLSARSNRVGKPDRPEISAASLKVRETHPHIHNNHPGVPLRRRRGPGRLTAMAGSRSTGAGRANLPPASTRGCAGHQRRKQRQNSRGRRQKLGVSMLMNEAFALQLEVRPTLSCCLLGPVAAQVQPGLPAA